MKKKHGIAGLVGLGVAAAAGAAAVLAAQRWKELQEERPQVDEEAIFLDLDGDGEADVKLEDRDGDGRIDTVTADTTGDGSMDTTLVDLTGDGEPDVLITGNPELLKELRDSGMEVTEDNSPDEQE